MSYLRGRKRGYMVQQARKKFEEDDIQIDACAKVIDADIGYWVAAWLWIPKEDTDDKSD